MTVEVTLDAVPFKVLLDLEAPWPRGIPDLETARRALLERVRVPELPISVQERIEEPFHTTSGVSAAEAESLQVPATSRRSLPPPPPLPPAAHPPPLPPP